MLLSLRYPSPEVSRGRHPRRGAGGFALAFAAALLSSVAFGGETTASTVSTTAASAAPSAADALATAPSSAWDISSAVRASVGWRENVTVSTVNPINRGFWRAEAESFGLRPIGSHLRFIGFLSGDVLRYFNPPGSVSGEQQWVGDLQLRYEPTPALRTTLKGVAFLQDTFIDPSESEGSQQPATAVRFWGGYTSLAQRIALPGHFALEPSFQVKRIDFKRGYNGDYNETRPGLRLEWKRSDLLALSAAAYDHVRHYSQLNPGSAGRPIRDRLLGLRQKEGEFKATSRFTRRGEWTITALAGMLQNRDRTNGFLDYDQKRAQLEIGWEGARWRATASGEARRLTYRTQLVGLGAEQTGRIADITETSARVERDLPRHWTLFAENRWERNRSNIHDEFFRFSYRTNTTLFGVQRSF